MQRSLATNNVETGHEMRQTTSREITADALINTVLTTKVKDAVAGSDMREEAVS